MEHLSKNHNWNLTYMAIANLIGQHSKAERKKVGAVLVKANRIISIGYNGTPGGFDNCCEADGQTKQEVLHAESNCISKCACSSESSENAVLYVTLSPCVDCAKLIIQCKIKAVYYKEAYRNIDGLNLLTKAKIYHEQL